MAENDFERKPARYTLRLARQLEKAINYLHDNHASKQAEIMGRRFFEIVRVLERQPGIGTKYMKGMRKFPLDKFSYNIYYRELETEIEILGIRHTSRGTEFQEG